MIKQINIIKALGVFDNYQASADLPEFKKYNLIYGWNASGKTTLSRLLRCFELQKMSDDFPEAEFQLQTDSEIISNTILSQKFNIRVFNKDFIDENVFTQEDTVRPIYYLGKEDIEQKQKIETLKKQEEELKIQIDSEEKNLENTKKFKERLITEKAKKIKEFLRTEGTDKYTNYNKSDFCEKIELINEETKNQNILKEDALNEKKRAINQTVKEKMTSLTEQILFNKEDVEKISKILKTEVISESIEKLKNNSNLNKWVKEGLDLYNQFEEENCHFCEQPIPENRIEALKKHFSQSYENLIKYIDALERDWETKKIEISIPDKTALYEDLSQKFQEEKNKLNKEIKRYNLSITKVLEKLKQKKQDPFKIAEEIYFESFQIKNLIDKINEIISQHNKKTNDFTNTKFSEKQNIEKHFLSESHEEYQNLKDEINNFNTSVNNLRDEKSKIETQIDQLSQKRRDYKITAKKMNNKLKSFLGRDELIFEATNMENEGYYIKRASNGKFAKSLSEGEKTAIALIYFLSKLNEESFDLNKGIIVVDDPVSSLDSNSVFQAFGFIKSEIKTAKQVFILTHNFDFFKHIKHWFKRDYKENSEFFMIKNSFEKNKRTARLDPLDNLLKDYDSEYQYLFRLLYRLSSDGNNTLKEIYPFPNIARKFMETFLSFKFPSEKNLDALFSKAKRKTSFDPGKIKKIKRFINAHSHSDIDKITGWDINPWSEGAQIIQDILKLVEELDIEHYKRLKALN